MSNRKLSVFELNIIHIVLSTAIADKECPENFLGVLSKMHDCIKSLVGSFDPKVNNNLWVLANNPVFAAEPRLNGKNAIDGFLDGVLDQMAKDMAEHKVLVQVPTGAGLNRNPSLEHQVTMTVTPITTSTTDIVLQLETTVPFNPNRELTNEEFCKLTFPQQQEYIKHRPATETF